MEKDNILENEITEKKKATTKKKVASSSKDETKSTATKKATTKKVATKKAATLEDGAEKPAKKTSTKKATTTKKAASTKSASTKSTAKKSSTTKKTSSTKAATDKKETTKKVTKKADVKEPLESLLNKKIVIDEVEENFVDNVSNKSIDADLIKEEKEVIDNDKTEVKEIEGDIKKADLISEPKKFELPKKNTEPLKVNTPIDAQELDHVAILKKKMEAQKKLKENMLDDNQPQKPNVKFEVENNINYFDEEIQQKNEELSNEVESLKSENEKLKTEMTDKVESLKQENEKIKIEMSGEVESLKSENEKLKTEMTDKVESLKQENEKIKTEMSGEVESLKNENEKIKTEMIGEVEILKNENEKLKNEISDLMVDINDKEEKLIILTNSIVTKSTENELAKEVEILRKENKELQDKISTVNDQVQIECDDDKSIEKSDITEEDSSDNNENKQALAFEVIDKGEISLRIKLLNERIAEKDNQIKLVEEELNSLSEKDIVAEGFASEIKSIRKIRKESISLANLDLNELAKLVKSSEAKLIEKQEAYNNKCNEIKAFDENMKSKQLSYSEKENELYARSILFAEKDSLFVEIESHEENYKKLLNRYKVRLEKAEASLEKLNNAEADLINRYLSQLREDKFNSNEDYQMQLIERNALYEELNKLKKEIEVSYTEDKISFEQFDINSLKADLAKYTAKLSLINEKYAEREKIEKVLLKNEQNVKDYYDAFRNRETVLFNINENNLRIKSLEAKLSTENDDVKKEVLKSRIESINILVSDDKEKANYYNNIIEKSRDDEKVAFYIKLMNSMIELKDKEKEFTFKVENIKSNIAKLEDE